VTDAYFHFTPSQIMLAALSIADSGLAEIFINNAMNTPRSANSNSEAAKYNTEGSGEASRELKTKVLHSIQLCRDMLSEEPPERLSEYWGTVSDS
jgi:cyclin H